MDPMPASLIESVPRQSYAVLAAGHSAAILRCVGCRTPRGNTTLCWLQDIPWQSYAVLAAGHPRQSYTMLSEGPRGNPTLLAAGHPAKPYAVSNTRHDSLQESLCDATLSGGNGNARGFLVFLQLK